jgi:hypothetical protein
MLRPYRFLAVNLRVIGSPQTLRNATGPPRLFVERLLLKVTEEP